jgi:2,4-dienoyl-CoA reductase-like NADH-dependent reductase (Old Yellow Enzyme family)
VASARSADSASLMRTLLDDVDIEPLFRPLDMVGLRLRNRFVMAPMTRFASPLGVPDAAVAAYYARRAASLGLVITEGTYIDHPSAGSHADIPHLYGDEALRGWRLVVDEVHRAGGVIFPQLWHLGGTRVAGSPPNSDAPVVSPSGLGLDGQHIGEPLTIRQIDDIIASFVRAAADAREAGFDGVELHGAHGYLLDQFWWTNTNRRSDHYGGNARNRVRISAEVVSAIRDRLGPHFPISYRYSQGKSTGRYHVRVAETPRQLDELLSPLVDAGVTVFHVSARRYWLPEFESSDRTLAGWTKHLSGLPTITLGSVGVAAAFRGDDEDAQESLTLAPLVRLLDRGEFDLVGLGRAILADPDWVRKLRTSRTHEITPYSKASESVVF